MDASAFFQSKGTYTNASHLATGDVDVTIRGVEMEPRGRLPQPPSGPRSR
jgi:hypothetical protein